MGNACPSLCISPHPNTLLYDTCSEIVVIGQDLVEALGVRVLANRLFEMERVNGATTWTVGCAEFLSMQVGGATAFHSGFTDTSSDTLALAISMKDLLRVFSGLASGGGHRVYIS